MIPGFHLSSLHFHDPISAVAQLANRGFGVIAIRPQRGLWDKRTRWFEMATEELGLAAKEHNVKIVVDLDGVYYDDPNCRDPFSLASEDSKISQMARDSIHQWISCSEPLEPAAITFSSGAVDPHNAGGTRKTGDLILGDPEPAASQSVVDESTLERLAASVESLYEAANTSGTVLAMRPVASHAIATVAQFERFEQWLSGGVKLGLAADVGEMLLGGEFPIGARLARLTHRLTCIYLREPDVLLGCDQRFGQGDIDLGRVWQVITQSGFSGPGIFRACGHGQIGLELANQAMSLLEPGHGGSEI